MAVKGSAAELSIIKQIELLASKRPNAISLAQGIPSFDTPEPIKQRVREAIDRGVVAKYSLAPGMSELREAIEEHLGERGMLYDYETEIIVTVGSIEAITATLLATVGPGDEVLVTTPSYVSYKDSIRLTGAVPVFVPLDEEREWQVVIDAFKNATTTNTKAAIICNPNNPTGTLFSKKDLVVLGEWAKERGILLITDEVYEDFLYDKEDRLNYFSLAMDQRFRDCVVRVFSFSKAFAMTGWRIGYLHTHATLARQILKVHDTLVTCAPVVSQYAALAALEMTTSDWQPYLKEYALRRDVMCDELLALRDFFSFVRPRASYFAFPRLVTTQFPGYTNSHAFALDLLEETGLALVPGSAFGPSGEDHVRLSFGRSRDDIIEGMKRLSQYCHQR